MEWLPESPDIDLIENLWSIIQIIGFENRKHYSNNGHLWKAIKTAESNIKFGTVEMLIK